MAIELVSGVSFHVHASSWKVAGSGQVLSTGIFGSGESGGKTSGDRCGRHVDVVGMDIRRGGGKCGRSSDLKVVNAPCHGKLGGAQLLSRFKSWRDTSKIKECDLN